jgi:hypothetical protein
LRILESQHGDDHDSDVSTQANHNPDSVLFTHDRLYKHNLVRINYTTYDIRRSQDVVNTSTSHNNIMTLAHTDNGENSDPFRYARVLGVYHANVVYTGPGMVGYEPRRMEFLWVRWYQRVRTTGWRWDAYKLDRIKFLPVAAEDAFGFINPLDVLRACHVIPAFARGRLHADGVGLSRCAMDASDWEMYYLNP